MEKTVSDFLSLQKISFCFHQFPETFAEPGENGHCL